MSHIARAKESWDAAAVNVGLFVTHVSQLCATRHDSIRCAT